MVGDLEVLEDLGVVGDKHIDLEGMVAYRVGERQEVQLGRPEVDSPLCIQQEDVLLGEVDNFLALEV